MTYLDDYMKWLEKHREKSNGYFEQLYNLCDSTREFSEMLEKVLSDYKREDDKSGAYALNYCLADMMADCARLMLATWGEEDRSND